MEDCLFGLVHLQEHNMVHADLRPELVSVPVKRGAGFQLLDRLGDPSPPNQVQLNNLKAGKSLYMSPALFHALSSREPKVRHNPFKSDIFSLGMVVLEAGLLESVQGVYSSSKGDIDHDVLVDLVERFFTRYPRNYILQEILLVMLEFSETLRQEPAKLLKTLQSLRVTQLEDSQLIDGAISRTKPESSAMDQVRITPHGFQLADTNLVNLSILHGLQPSPDQVSRENSFRKSLVGMLRNRNSHNISGQVQISRGPHEHVDSIHSGADPVIYRSRPDRVDQQTNPNTQILRSNRQTNQSDQQTGMVESQLTKRVDLDSNRVSLNGNGASFSRASEGSRRNVTKINGLVVRRVSDDSQHLRQRANSDQHSSFGPPRISVQNTIGSIAVDTKLSHIPEENVYKSNAQSGLQNSQGQAPIDPSRASQPRADQASARLGVSLQVPSKVDPNESLQIIESQFSERKAQGSSLHASFSNQDVYLLYRGPVVMLQNYEVRFCDAKALEVLDLNQINNVDNSGGLLCDTQPSQDTATLNVKTGAGSAQDSRIGSDRIGGHTQGPSFGSLANGSRVTNPVRTSSQVRRIRIDHTGARNSFGVDLSQNGQQVQIAKNVIIQRDGQNPVSKPQESNGTNRVFSFRDKGSVVNDSTVSQPRSTQKKVNPIARQLEKQATSNIQTGHKRHATSSIVNQKRQSPVVRTIRKQVSTVSRDQQRPKFTFSDRAIRVNRSIQVASKAEPGRSVHRRDQSAKRSMLQLVWPSRNRQRRDTPRRPGQSPRRTGTDGTRTLVLGTSTVAPRPTRGPDRGRGNCTWSRAMRSTSATSS